MHTIPKHLIERALEVVNGCDKRKYKILKYIQDKAGILTEEEKNNIITFLLASAIKEFVFSDDAKAKVLMLELLN